jgi:hypothetical protein
MPLHVFGSSCFWFFFIVMFFLQVTIQMDITEKLRVYERTPSPFLQSIQFSRPTVSDLLKTMICNILYRNLQLEPAKILDASQTFLLKEFCVRYGLSVLTMYVLLIERSSLLLDKLGSYLVSKTNYLSSLASWVNMLGSPNSKPYTLAEFKSLESSRNRIRQFLCNLLVDPQPFLSLLVDLRLLLAWCRHPVLLPPVIVPTTDQQMEALDAARSDEAGEANALSDINHNSVLLSKLRALRASVINHGMSSSIPTFATDCCNVAPLATNSDLLDSFIIEISAGSFSMGNAKLCAPAVLNSFCSVLGPVFSAVVCVPILIYLSQDINVNIVSYSASILGAVIVVLCKSDDSSLPTPENSIYDGELGAIATHLSMSKAIKGAAEILFALSKSESDQVRCAIITQALPVMLNQTGVARILGLHLYYLMTTDSSEHLLHLSLKNTRAVFSEPFPADYSHISADIVAQQWVRVVQRIVPHPGVEESLISVRKCFRVSYVSGLTCFPFRCARVFLSFYAASKTTTKLLPQF